MEYIATVWKNPLDLRKVQELLDAGVTTLRIKWAHISTEEVLNVLHTLQTYLRDQKSSVHILLDMPEVKIRIGELKLVKEPVVTEKFYTIRTAEYSESVDSFIPCSFAQYRTYFSVGERVIIGDGELTFEVKEITSDTEMVVAFLNTGELCQYRGLFSSRLADTFDHTASIIEAIPYIKEVKPDALALSFVNGAAYIERVRQVIEQECGDTWQPRLYAKIESEQGIIHAEEIMNVADCIVVARGDLALTTDYARIILEQKKLCSLGKENGVDVVVATQILDSCLTNSVPSRPDIADVTNIVLDGATGMWFSKSTSQADYPGQIVRVAREICEAVEREMHQKDS